MWNSCELRGVTMSMDSCTEQVDRTLTTWDGARRAQTRRWARMSLSEAILALEEMQVLAERLSQPSKSGST